MQLDRLFENAGSQAPVVGLTHGFYRYPARFSPQFARAAIEAFSKVSETVMDPFMGGGTSAVEALGLGRRFLGSDLNSLSVFITRTKTTPLTRADEENVRSWARVMAENGTVRLWDAPPDEWAPYQINTPWWLRRAIGHAILGAKELSANRRQEDFARSVILKTAQWALDCKDATPSSRRFFVALSANAEAMLSALRDFRSRLGDAFQDQPLRALRHRRLIHCDASAIGEHSRVPQAWLPPKLILTSPPYFGVHILYHRWQVQGRRETPAPFWIADSKDGMGGSFYTFGDRQRHTMETYLTRLQACFASIVKTMDKRSKVVQLVAFSNPSAQLEPYLDTMGAAGLHEAGIAEQQGRFWRTVPNRKWYAKLRGGTPPSQELLLIHRRA
jgi:DNA modification methylase